MIETRWETREYGWALVVDDRGSYWNLVLIHNNPSCWTVEYWHHSSFNGGANWVTEHMDASVPIETVKQAAWATWVLNHSRAFNNAMEN